jgi:hypothetical protein
MSPGGSNGAYESDARRSISVLRLSPSFPPLLTFRIPLLLRQRCPKMLTLAPFLFFFSFFLIFSPQSGASTPFRSHLCLADFHFTSSPRTATAAPTPPILTRDLLSRRQIANSVGNEVLAEELGIAITKWHLAALENVGGEEKCGECTTFLAEEKARFLPSSFSLPSPDLASSSRTA